MALGIVGMAENDFYQTTPRTFSNIMRGKEKLLERENEREKTQWEMHREIAVNVIRPHLGKAAQRKSLQQLYPLPWDKETKTQTKKSSPKDVKKFWDEIDKKEKRKK